MERIILGVFVIALALRVVTLSLTPVSANTPRRTIREVQRATDGAFRDGLFHGRMDAEHARKPHLTSGRWSTEQDRSSFVAGYQEGYLHLRDLQTAIPEPGPQTAEQMGYRDGMTDGAHDRGSFHRFQVNKSRNYREGGREYSASQGSREQFERSYREAYCNGYQEGYYGERRSVSRSDSDPFPSAS